MRATNTQLSTDLVQLGLVAPQSISAAADTGWQDASKGFRLAAIIALGAQLGVTVTALQAQDNTGTGSKPLTINKGNASVAFASGTANNTSAVLDLDPVDLANGFRFVKLVCTPAGASLLGAVLYAVGLRFEAPNQTTWP